MVLPSSSTLSSERKAYLTPKSLTSGGKVPMKPRGCYRSHIPKALEHLTGLPNPQPSQEPPAPGPQQAPVTHKPNGSVGKNIYIYISKKSGEREG